MSELNGELTIRRARPEDASRCGDIAVAAWQSVYESFRKMMGEEIHRLRNTGWQDRKRSSVENHIRNNPDMAVVTEVDGEIAGFMTIHTDEEKKLGTIGNNAVDPEYQGYGIGTRQCERALEILKQQGMEYAEVFTGLDESHAPARAMYENAGFDRSTPHIRYYKLLD